MKMTIMALKRATTVNVNEAKVRLDDLLRRVVADEEFVITRNHVPVARLIQALRPGSRTPGSGRGLIIMAPDFDAPIPDFEESER
jgi:prevent-host-death family protein